MTTDKGNVFLCFGGGFGGGGGGGGVGGGGGGGRRGEHTITLSTANLHMREIVYEVGKQNQDKTVCRLGVGKVQALQGARQVKVLAAGHATPLCVCQSTSWISLHPCMRWLR